MKVRRRIFAVDVTCPKVREFRVVSMPEYCTVLKTLLAVIRASKERVSPRGTVRESEASTATVPGPIIEPREAVPKTFAGVVNAAGLNQFRIVPDPEIGCEKIRSGRRELLVPVAVSATVAT
jgi:hypothetical protein